MLSISQPMKGAGKGDYYLELAREDYYPNCGGRSLPLQKHGRSNLRSKLQRKYHGFRIVPLPIR